MSKSQKIVSSKKNVSQNDIYNDFAINLISSTNSKFFKLFSSKYIEKLMKNYKIRVQKKKKILFQQNSFLIKRNNFIKNLAKIQNTFIAKQKKISSYQNVKNTLIAKNTQSKTRFFSKISRFHKRFAIEFEYEFVIELKFHSRKSNFQIK